MTGVRFGELGFEGRCDGCHEWYPLALEFWPVWRGLKYCRSCYLERRALTERDNATYQRLWRAQNRVAYAAQKDRKNAAARVRHHERMLMDPAYAAKKREASKRHESMARQTEAKRESDRLRMRATRATIRAARQRAAA